MTRRRAAAVVLLILVLALAGCSVVFRPIKQGTATLFKHGSVEVKVTEGEIPDLGTFTLKEAGRYDGWAMEDGTNESIDGSRAVFESDQGWQLYLERFGRDDTDGEVFLRYVPTEGDPTYGFTCATENLVTTVARFSGTLDCSQTIPREPSPLRIEITVDLTP